MILRGDCIEQMRELDEASIDAVVCDPPYGIGFMGHEWDQPGVEIAMLAGRYDLSRSANHAFQDWCTAWTTECLRVLKPGGHLLAFGGTRTYHRLACAVEDAGFEIRDSLIWIYGSGFPKSLDVSKAIDKRRNDEPDVRMVCRWLRSSIEDSRETVKSIAERFGFHPRMVEHWAARDTDSQPTLPTLEQWDQLRKLLDFGEEMDAEVLRLNLRKGEPGEAWADRPVTGEVEEWENRSNYALTSRDGLRREVAVSLEARQWEGWGTAPKPAHEPIVVARKPLGGTVAATVLEHGTGALNVDGCRVGADEDTARKRALVADTAAPFGRGAEMGGDGHDGGRWPANAIFSPEAAEELDRQSGTLTSGSRAEGVRKGLGYHGADGDGGPAIDGDRGGASRFFYVAKASRAGRNAGLIRCACDTFTPSVNEAPRASTPAASDTRPPRATTEPTSEDGSGSSTTGSGSKSTARSPKASTSTTTTATSRTTGSGTFASSTRLPTSAPTPPTTESTKANGSAAATSAESGSPQPPSTGISTETGGCSTGDADPATSKSSSRPSSAGELHCPECGGVRGGHPTVKPIDLIRWLVRLVTPPEGTVLDPFTGSGTTGIAAHLEGFDFIGIEREDEYAEIAEARIEWWSQFPVGTDTDAALGVEAVDRKQRESGQESLL